MICILLVNFRLLRLVILCNWTLVALCCCMNIILTCFLSTIAQPWRHDRLSLIDWLPSGVTKMLRGKLKPLNEMLESQAKTQLWLPSGVTKMLRGKLMPLNEMLESQAKTQLWALEMVPKGFWCDDKPIQARNKACTWQNSNRSPIKKKILYNT